jgi:hypothetical protein
VADIFSQRQKIAFAPRRRLVDQGLYFLNLFD